VRSRVRRDPTNGTLTHAACLSFRPIAGCRHDRRALVEAVLLSGDGASLYMYGLDAIHAYVTVPAGLESGDIDVYVNDPTLAVGCAR
jgi:hypothetical protein